MMAAILLGAQSVKDYGACCGPKRLKNSGVLVCVNAQNFFKNAVTIQIRHGELHC